MHENLTTYFASPERLGLNEVRRQAASVLGSEAIRLADCLPYMLLMLNDMRQIVFANKAVLETVGAENIEDVLGKRLGEMLGCVHAGEMKAGCGTSKFCTQCGSARAIIKGLAGETGVDQCRMLRDMPKGVQGLTLEVTAVPYEIDGERMTAFTALDVGENIRRKAMERLFYHDVLNLAGGLDGAMESFAEEFSKVNPDLCDVLSFTVRSLYEEISAQQTLTAAESGELKTWPKTLQSREMVDSVASLYSMHSVARTRKIEVASDFDDVALRSDPVLLKRVLGNLVKNALEASEVAEEIVIGCDRLSEDVSFWVHNPGFIPENVQLQIFSPSFSTKGEGRGLGTYSIKLFTETYLGGRVSFVSSQDEGTTFTVVLPLSLTGNA